MVQRRAVRASVWLDASRCIRTATVNAQGMPEPMRSNAKVGDREWFLYRRLAEEICAYTGQSRFVDVANPH